MLRSVQNRVSPSFMGVSGLGRDSSHAAAAVPGAIAGRRLADTAGGRRAGWPFSIRSRYCGYEHP